MICSPSLYTLVPITSTTFRRSETYKGKKDNTLDNTVFVFNNTNTVVFDNTNGFELCRSPYMQIFFNTYTIGPLYPQMRNPGAKEGPV